MTRTALVTGGASGLGAATADRLRADSITVTTLDLADADACADVTDEEERTATRIWIRAASLDGS